MKIRRPLKERIQQGLNPDRQMTSISLRLPQDVVDDLKKVAPLMGFSGYQPLIKAYIGKGLRMDIAQLEAEENSAAAQEKSHEMVQETVAAWPEAVITKPEQEGPEIWLEALNDVGTSTNTSKDKQNLNLARPFMALKLMEDRFKKLSHDAEFRALWQKLEEMLLAK